MAEAIFTGTSKTPDKIKDPEASADPTYPGAAGTKYVKADKTCPKNIFGNCWGYPKDKKVKYQIRASAM